MTPNIIIITELIPVRNRVDIIDYSSVFRDLSLP